MADADDDAFLYGDDTNGSATGDAAQLAAQLEASAATETAPPGTEASVSQDGFTGFSTPDVATVEVPTNDLNGGEGDENDVVEAAASGDPAEVVEEEGVAGGAGEDEDDEDSDDDDDGIAIQIDKRVIEEAKTSYQTLGKGRVVPGAVGPGAPGGVQPAEKQGKFSVADFESPGQVNGKEPHEMAEDLATVQEAEKPWKKPGADITDYFNYGFTEDTWQAYCHKQRRMRLAESGAGLPLPPGVTAPTGVPSKVTTLPSTIPTLGAPLKPKVEAGSKLDVSVPPPAATPEPSAISVMTHEKRTYSNKVMEKTGMGAPPQGGPPPPGGPGGMDFSVPPPGGFSAPPPGIPPPGLPPPGIPPPGIPPPGFPPPSGAPGEFDYAAGAPPEQPPQHDYEFGGAYNEPTQESQWSVPPPSFDGGGPPPHGGPPPGHLGPPPGDAPPGDAGYEGGGPDRDPWGQRDLRRDDRDDRRRRDYRDYGGDSRKRRRSRSRSPPPEHRGHRGGYREDYRERDRDRDHRGYRERRYPPPEDRGRDDRIRDDRRRDDRDRERRDDRDRDGDRERRDDRDRDGDGRERSRGEDREEGGSRRERSSRSRSRSPSSHKHKKSKRDKRDRSEREVEIKREIKEEPEERME